MTGNKMHRAEHRGRSKAEGNRRGARLCSIILIPLLCVIFYAMTTTTTARGQEITDRMVATVNGGVRTDLITYSDLLWQLALQPGTPLTNPRSEDLNAALQSLINQRLIL